MGEKWTLSSEKETIYNLSGNRVPCRSQVALRREWWMKWGPGSSEHSMPAAQCGMTWSLEGSLRLHKLHIFWASPGVSFHGMLLEFLLAKVGIVGREGKRLPLEEHLSQTIGAYTIQFSGQCISLHFPPVSYLKYKEGNENVTYALFSGGNFP